VTMKVLFVASEGVPFVKTGGLGDVIGSLPKELQKQDVDVRLVLPKYGEISQEFRKKMTVKASFTVPLGWRNQYCGIEELLYNGLHCYFIDNEYYFKRQGVYGYGDDAERYAFFCRAVLEALPHLDFAPQILHCHDWQTGMIGAFLKAHYQRNPYYTRINTIFTIHNLQYQGIFSKAILGDVLGLSEEYFTIDGIEYYGQINAMKAGLVFSDLITTVSNTYVEEIQTPYFGEGLDGLLRARNRDLYGVVNGIDYEVYNPETDPHISVTYDEKNVQKQENKMKLQERLGLPVRPEVPLLAIVSRLVQAKGFDLLACFLEEILAMDVQLVVLGTGEEQYQALFRHAAWRHPDKVSANIQFDERLAQQIYAASDLFLMPSRFEPCGIGQLIALRYGSLPVVRETGGLKDTVQSYNEHTGAGNGFSFTNYNAHDMLHTIKRAIGFFYDKPVWLNIVQNAMRTDYSWHESARRYQALYRKLLNTEAEHADKSRTI
jgi:starch synthase